MVMMMIRSSRPQPLHPWLVRAASGPCCVSGPLFPPKAAGSYSGTRQKLRNEAGSSIPTLRKASAGPNGYYSRRRFRNLSRLKTLAGTRESPTLCGRLQLTTSSKPAKQQTLPGMRGLSVQTRLLCRSAVGIPAGTAIRRRQSLPRVWQVSRKAKILGCER